MGVVALKLLPSNRKLRILCVNNRVFFACINSVFAVLIEIILHRLGVVTWEWSWWNASMPILIFLVGYVPFFVVAYLVHDMARIRGKVIAVSAIFGVDVVGAIVFGLLGWLCAIDGAGEGIAQAESRARFTARRSTASTHGADFA